MTPEVAEWHASSGDSQPPAGGALQAVHNTECDRTRQGRWPTFTAAMRWSGGQPEDTIHAQKVASWEPLPRGGQGADFGVRLTRH